MRRALAALAVLAACERSGGPTEKAGVLVEDDRRAPVDVVGVSPLDFRCDSVAPLDAVSAALGVRVVETDAAMPPAAGVPRTCVFTAEDPAAPHSWSFDIDCRERALATGEALMVELASRDGSQPVLVGRSGIDAADSALLFIDDDAPCYVRVLGPDAARRTALARVIAERLAPRTAPGKVSYR
jgi:hypothetical protein